MLESLHIENIAVIKSLDIDFEGGLCVLCHYLSNYFSLETLGHATIT